MYPIVCSKNQRGGEMKTEVPQCGLRVLPGCWLQRAGEQVVNVQAFCLNSILCVYNTVGLQVE